MSQRIFRMNTCWLVSLALISGLLGACVTSETEVRTAAVPANQTVAYPGGQYKLYGSGTAASPRESSDADRGISSGTVQTLRERHGRVSVLLGLDPHGCGSLDAAGPAGAARESSDADRGISSGTVPALREWYGRVSVLLGLGSHGHGSLDGAGPAGATRESGDADRGISSGTVPALRERHGRGAVLLGLGPHGSYRSAASAAASLRPGRSQRSVAYRGPARTEKATVRRASARVEGKMCA